MDHLVCQVPVLFQLQNVGPESPVKVFTKINFYQEISSISGQLNCNSQDVVDPHLMDVLKYGAKLRVGIKELTKGTVASLSFTNLLPHAALGYKLMLYSQARCTQCFHTCKVRCLARWTIIEVCKRGANFHASIMLHADLHELAGV